LVAGCKSDAASASAEESDTTDKQVTVESSESRKEVATGKDEQVASEKEVTAVMMQIAENVQKASSKITVKHPRELIFPKEFIVLDQIETKDGFTLSLQTSKSESDQVSKQMIALLKSDKFTDYRSDDIGGLFTLHSATRARSDLSYIFTSTQNESGEYLVQYTVVKK
jgi:hypothetical protein